VIDYGTLRGAWVPPGEYRVRLIVGNDTLQRTFTVRADPRVTSSTADLVAQYVAARRVIARIDEVVSEVKRVEDLQSQIDDRVKRLTEGSASAIDIAAAKDSAKALRSRLEAVRAELYEVGCHVDQCTLDMPTKLYNKFITLNMQVQVGAYAPTQQHGTMYDGLKAQLDRQLRTLQQLESEDVARLNALLERLGLPPLHLPTRQRVM
jgi:hypothetical protein